MTNDPSEFDAALDYIFSALIEAGADKAALNQTKARFDNEFSDLFNQQTIYQYIISFARSELDVQTVGSRGLGRMTEYVPRLGGYFRKGMSSLDPAKMDMIQAKLSNCILMAYVAMTVLTPIEVSKWKTEHPFESGCQISTLFRPILGGVDWHGLNIALGKPIAEFRELLGSLGLHGGGFITTDKTDEILTGYATAGVALRQAELGVFGSWDRHLTNRDAHK